MSARDFNAGVVESADTVHKIAEALAASNGSDPEVAKRIAEILEMVSEEIRALAYKIGEARK